ncbi:MAG: metalloregulator ArsR/SmtB family transcription factor [Bacteroidota bacterium]|nr:metalloregulator ArsR/SmtB family transcription factor [Bacteroidota bacterium]MDX5426918.1 metalloregulator ArsR/SmtB family transcription factor [Bacteroidota bacterium]MDX5447544.1 metalloregulator ArsR/SmtB family transcription factor [Bacteroidota bacterium]MDX5504906.1 metalloregulator ArsR/SmtB family transcription factor [Bacteroidota bacterium]
MGVTRTHLFTEEQNELARIAKVLAHPARIAILQHLTEYNACYNGDLVQELGLAQATISQHLRELKDLGILQGTIEGVSVSYCINKDKWKEIKERLEKFLDIPMIKDSNCC